MPTILVDYRDVFLHGALLTFSLTLGALAAGMVLGPIIGMMRASTRRPLRLIATGYVELFRATPTLVQLVWIYFALPVITGVQLSAFMSALVGLAMHEGAYMGEIFRAGIQSIDRGQGEAARALGMSYWETMRHVILPQAVKRMVPPLINEFASLIKLTSLASVLAVPELLHTANDVIADTFRPMQVYTTVALTYAVLTLPVIYFASWVDARWSAR